MTPERARAVDDALSALPLEDRLVSLIVSVLESESRTPYAVGTLIAVASILARHLPPVQRAAIAWHLSAAAEECDALWQ